MKISKTTIEVLTNFADINQNLYLRAGNKSSSYAVSNDVFAVAVFEDDDFPVDFPIYNLKEFLGAINLFDNPELDFSEDGKEVVISSGKYAVRYNAAELDHIHYKDKDPKSFDMDVVVDLTAQQLQSIMKAAQTLKAPDVSIVSDGEKVEAVVTDRERSNANSFRIELCEGNGVSYEFHQKVKRLNLLPGDYKLEISSKNIGIWTRGTGNVKYYISFEKDSSYNG